ncbi:MAG TPA: membrane protein insertase YidC [Gemmatimonadales bacterium]|nr:membrane protein insertase YidC [Gemmatimonadales bacterium]
MDRRVLLAVVLMMAVAILPSMFFKSKKPPASLGARPAIQVTDTTRPSLVPLAPRDSAGSSAPPAQSSAAEDTILVASPLYRYAFSTRGGRMIEATFLEYPSMRPEEHRRPAQILTPKSDLLGLGLLSGRDTVWLRGWSFEPSARSLDVQAPTTLRLTARQGGVVVALTYTFRPDDYLIDVAGQVEGLGPDGGTVLVGMGPGLRNTESDSVEHARELGVVVKDSKAALTRFGKLKMHQPVAFNGPFEWVAVKSKYFVTAILAPDSSGTGRNGGIGGATAVATDSAGRTTTAATVLAGIPVRSAGAFHFQLYAGPLEYPRLRAIGHDFDDVNPYGWPGFRTIIRPVALGARSLLVWMHQSLGLAYGVGLILFGILIRILLWPLNQKAMRSTMAMQAVQPLIKELQDKYKADPQRLQQEMFKLYKEHNVNPFGGCWPMLLPWPILLAFFFVFQNTIELRGAAFLWLPDLSRPDPLLIIPVVMGLSMFALSKIGQLGMPPNPQMKMMLYLMPAMMTFLFLKFASGLNLYYTVMNFASLPQQWMLSRERLRRQVPVAPVPALPKKKSG